MFIKHFKNKGSKILYLFKETFSGFVEDNVMSLSASLSYYTIFSLPPLLIIIITLSGVFFGEDAVQGQLFSQINGLVGNEAALQVQEAIKNVRQTGYGSFPAVISGLFLIVIASTVFAEMQSSINFIWGIKAKPDKGLLRFIKSRLMSFSMIASVGFLLLVGLVINAVMDILSEQLRSYFPMEFVNLFFVINYLIMFIIITVLFTVIFKTLPDGRVVMRDCLIGASFTAVLFLLGKFAIGFYLGNSALGTIYGAAGSLILILIWVYYSAMILYFGAEFTKVYAITHGKDIVPNAYTVRISKKEVEIDT
jgi:membrane protein